MNVMEPDTEAGIIEVIRGAVSTGHPLEIAGNETKRGLGLPLQGNLLSLAGFSGIIACEPEEMIITARAGTPLVEIEQALARHGQCLAFEPSSWSGLWHTSSEGATIGGTVAAGVAGPRRFAAGAARDHLLGFRAIDGRAEAFKAGGKVVKNVTGYDLPKLAAGSFGTLFVMTELTLRAVPAPRAVVVIAVMGQEPEAAFAMLRDLSMSAFEPTALSYVPSPAASRAGLGDAAITLARFEGDAEGAGARARAAATMCGAASKTLDEVSATKAVSVLKDVAPMFDPEADLWKLSVPPTSAIHALEELSPTTFAADWAGGLLWLEMPPVHSPASVHACARKLGGHATHMRRSQTHVAARDIFPVLDPVTQALTARLKLAFDPLRILNRGRMYRDI
jgi:glycolate oxidase FAD binding subunit